MGKVILFFWMSFISNGQSEDLVLKTLKEKVINEALTNKVIKRNEPFYVI
jgi:hypothetical protein